MERHWHYWQPSLSVSYYYYYLQHMMEMLAFQK